MVLARAGVAGVLFLTVGSNETRTALAFKPILHKQIDTKLMNEKSSFHNVSNRPIQYCSSTIYLCFNHLFEIWYLSVCNYYRSSSYSVTNHRSIRVADSFVGTVLAISTIIWLHWYSKLHTLRPCIRRDYKKKNYYMNVTLPNDSTTPGLIISFK